MEINTDTEEFGHFIDMALGAGGDDLSNEMFLNLHIVGLALAHVIYHPELQIQDDENAESVPVLVEDPCQIIYMLRKVWEVLDKTPTLPELFVRFTHWVSCFIECCQVVSAWTLMAFLCYSFIGKMQPVERSVSDGQRFPRLNTGVYLY